MLRAVAVLLAALAAAPDLARAMGPAARANGRPSFAVLPFDLPEPYRDRRDALVTLVAARLERSGGRVVTRADVSAILGFERERAQLEGGCGDACAEELTGLLGVRYVVNGQVASLGQEWLVALALYDQGTVRRHAERVASPDQFAAAFERGADELSALVLLDEAARAGKAPPRRERGQVAVTAGGSPDIAKLKVEYGYPFLPELWAVAQASAFVSTGQLSAVPTGIGVKYVFGPEHRVRPFAGILAGVAFAEQEAAFSLVATGGVWFVLWKGAGFVVEASADASTVQLQPDGHTVFTGTSTMGFSYTW